jgi:hypothetical protein
LLSSVNDSNKIELILSEEEMTKALATYFHVDFNDVRVSIADGGVSVSIPRKAFDIYRLDV